MGDFDTGGANAARRALHLPHQFGQRIRHLRQRAQHFAHLVLAIGDDAHRQVALANRARHLHDVGQGLGHAALHQPRADAHRCNDDGHDARHAPHGFQALVAGLVAQFGGAAFGQAHHALLRGLQGFELALGVALDVRLQRGCVARSLELLRSVQRSLQRLRLAGGGFQGCALHGVGEQRAQRRLHLGEFLQGLLLPALQQGRRSLIGRQCRPQGAQRLCLDQPAPARRQLQLALLVGLLLDRDGLRLHRAHGRAGGHEHQTDAQCNGRQPYLGFDAQRHSCFLLFRARNHIRM